MSDQAASARTATATGARLFLTQILTLIGYTLKEARHKWIFVALFVLTAMLLGALATLVSVDVVEGTIASARLFGTVDLPLADQSIRISEAVTVIQAFLVGLLSTFGLLVALFVSGNIIPRTLTPGWVELLVSQPISRPALILGRALGSMAVVGISLAFLFTGSWAILTWKTGFGNAGFLLAGVLILFAYVTVYSGMVLVGVVTRSSPVSILTGVGIWLAGLIVYPLHRFEEWTTAFRLGWPRTLADSTAEVLYWVLPKTPELTARATEATQLEPISMAPLLSSLPFAVVCLALACWWFTRQDY